LLFGVLVAFTGQGFSQTNLQYVGIKTTDEGAMRLTWSSVSNEIYEVDEADTLVDTNTGFTPWNDLYDNYPSQGTNTFIGDFGNYNLAPQILHPKYMPVRFYRIVDKGADTTSDEPSVAITSPTTGTAVSDELTITVVASTDQPVISGTKLYVDGQEMQMADSTTNYTDSSGMTNYEVDTYSINTCEWKNETHTFFATATVRSGFSGPMGSFPIYTGHAVSAFVPVTFSNLVSEIAFSQPFFEPALGQTQEVTATFAANCDWTLQIQDVNSNTVRNASGSGMSMTFDWDGTGDGETNIPDGVYSYFISAQTNGMAPQSLISGNSFLSRSPAISGSQAKELYAVAAGSEDVVPFAIYPKGFDTNGLTIFKATPSEVESLTASSSAESTVAMDSGGSVSADASGGGSAAASQNTPPSPQRPPAAPIKGSAGTIGVAYYDFQANKGFVVPFNGLPLTGNAGKVQIAGSYSNQLCDIIPESHNAAANFVAKMKSSGWSLGFNFSSGLFTLNDLRSASLGGNEMFGNVNLGLFIDHGAYGTSADFHSDASQTKEIYFPSDNPADGGSPWLRLSEFGLGGSLRWMAILACNSLRDQNYNGMNNAGVLPIKGNLHLLCGASTVCGVSENIGELWAKKMLGGFFIGAPETVAQAWYDAGHDAYAGTTVFSSPVIFHVAGSDNCFTDTLQSYSDPDGNITDTHFQVWP